MQILGKIARLISRAIGLQGSVVRRLLAGEPRGFCIACNRPVLAFLPFGGGSKAVPRLMKAAAVVGSDVDHFSCPKCWAHDRERHLLLYFAKLDFKSLIENGRVLHFAPEPAIKRFIESTKPAQYIRGDLFPTSADVQRVDLCKMLFNDASFDLVIANHVLEHVDDDGQALKEIFRILRPGGMAVLQTPYASALSKTIFDPAINSPALRSELYGQDDHVRLYGNDIFERFTSTGLQSKAQFHADLLPEIDYRIYGVNPLEPFMLFNKPVL
jgi:SAM-dependent methyltransferase